MTGIRCCCRRFSLVQLGEQPLLVAQAIGKQLLIQLPLRLAGCGMALAGLHELFAAFVVLIEAVIALRDTPNLLLSNVCLPTGSAQPEANEQSLIKLQR